MKDVFESVYRNIEKEGQLMNNLLVRGSKVNKIIVDEKADGKGRSNRLERNFDKLEREWGKVWDSKKLWHVARREDYYDSLFNKKDLENATTAAAFETLLNHCISSPALRWLGNKVVPLPENKFTLNYGVRGAAAREYDDKCHRIDSVVTLRLSQSMQKKHQYANRYLQLGLDCTIAKRPMKGDRDYSFEEESREWGINHFSDKISRSNNEVDAYQEPMPFGFSQVDFYQNFFEPDTETPGKLGLRGKIEQIPRFVIGFEKDLVKYARDKYVYVDTSGPHLKARFKDEDKVEKDQILVGMRFKMTSEIAAQADMMMRLMPENVEGNAKLAESKDKLRVLKELMDDAVLTSADAAIKEITSVNSTDGNKLALSLGQETDPKKRAKILEQFYRNTSNEYSYDPTYDGILDATERFVEYSEKDPKQELRTLQARNKGIMYVDGKIQDAKKMGDD